MTTMSGGPLGNVLQQGEAVRWEGRPDPSVIFEPADKFLVPFSVLWFGFAVFWTVTATIGAGLFGLFGLPFVGVGSYLAFGRFVTKRRDRRRTRYLVTDRRVLVVRGDGQRIQAVPVEQPPSLIERRRNHGTVAWGTSAVSSGGPFGWGRSASPLALRSTSWPGMPSLLDGVAFVDVPIERFEEVLALLDADEARRRSGTT